MDHAGTLMTALGTAFGAGGVGIVMATRGNMQRLRESLLTRRYLTWLALALLYGVPTLFGPVGVLALAILLATVAACEAAPLLGLTGPYRLALLALCATLPAIFIAGWAEWAAGLVLLVAIGLPILRGKTNDLAQGAPLACGALLIGWTLAHLVPLAQAGQGWITLALFGTAVSDVCAFVVGSLVGGAKLAPRISPGKTWSGLVGNLVGAALALLLTAPMLPSLTLPTIIAVVLIIGLGGCLGDLAESLLKRQAGVKDAGDWLPGFGGLLDRIDSLLAVAPLLVVLLAVIGLR
ncbi:MAG TPA: phosphatidate cytidylyltransferase [Thermomicrobiales bacterium]|jgi:phosphatidate cytidylyltransferase